MATEIRGEGDRAEQERLDALAALRILDTAPDVSFDALTRLASSMLDAPMATITLVDRDRQWFKSEVGIGLRETPRDISFCAQTIQQTEPLVVRDTLQDTRFADNPLVTGPPNVRFYVGIPLTTSTGHRVGTLCVLDLRPRSLDEQQLDMLRLLAAQAEQLLELHRQRLESDRVSEELERTTRHLVEAQRIAGLGSWEFDVETQRLWWSDEVFRIFGVERSTSSSPFADFRPFVHPDDAERCWEAQRRAEAGIEDIDLEHRIIRADGEVRWVHERSKLSVAPGSAPAHLAGTVQDITERRRTEDLLRQHDYMRQVASGLARLGAWAIDLDTQRLTFSDESCAIFDLPPGTEPAYEQAAGFYTPEWRPVMRDTYLACVETGAPFDLEVEVITATGRRRWIRSIGEAVRDSAGRIDRINGAFVDITERHADDQRFREQAELLDKAKDAIIVRDLDHRIVYWNRAAERLYGWTAAEAVGRSKPELLYPDDRVAFYEANREVRAHGEWSGRLEHRRADGRVIIVETQWTLVSDELGRPSRVFSINTDITERVELEQRVAQLQRLESLGQLTGGIAHDFNNLLTVIIGNAELLSMSLEHDGDLLPLAKMIRTAGERGSQLTSRLLAFARRQALEPRNVDLVDLLGDMRGLLERTLGEQVEIDIHHDPDLWQIEVDAAQLEAAVLNLAINARDAMPTGGHLVIEASNVVVDLSYASQNVEVEPGSYVLLALSDSGHGMTAEIRDRAFEPFFTTKDSGRGSGLGLSMVYGFTKQSGGHVKIYSEQGLGTTVKLYLPSAQVDGLAHRPDQGDDELVGGTETILLVEDDDLVRSHATQVLTDLGYDVHVASNGPEAIATMRVLGHIDLLFTDVVMPGGMSGPAVAEAVQSLQPDVRVLFTSGYTENGIVHHGRVDAGVELLHKPYRRSELAAKIRSVLDQPRP